MVSSFSTPLTRRKFRVCAGDDRPHTGKFLRLGGVGGDGCVRAHADFARSRRRASRAPGKVVEDSAHRPDLVGGLKPRQARTHRPGGAFMSATPATRTAASTIFTYPEQRQILPERLRKAGRRSGVGFCSREQGLERHHHAGRAEAALDSAASTKAFSTGSCGRAREPLDRGDLASPTFAASVRHQRTTSPSSSTEHAPQTP